MNTHKHSHRYVFDKSPRKMLPRTTAETIKTPPIVGVSFFVVKCDCGPSSLIGCPCFWCALRQNINLFPTSRTKKNDNRKAHIERKVTYLNMFKNEQLVPNILYIKLKNILHIQQIYQVRHCANLLTRLYYHLELFPISFP